MHTTDAPRSLMCIVPPSPANARACFRLPETAAPNLVEERQEQGVVQQDNGLTRGELEPLGGCSVPPAAHFSPGKEKTAKKKKKSHFSGPCPKPEAGPRGWCWSFTPRKQRARKGGDGITTPSHFETFIVGKIKSLI